MTLSTVQVSSPKDTLAETAIEQPIAIEARELSVYYGEFRAVKNVNLDIKYKQITAIIGPSGCGKSTVLRSFNRMNELVPSARVTGEVLLQLLERRLDNVIYRASFAESRARARQVVRHRFVKVNGRKVNIPSFTVKVGDEIQLAGKDVQLKSFRETYKSLEERGKPEWMEVSEDALAAKITRLPEKKDIGMVIEESLIVELYSK